MIYIQLLLTEVALKQMGLGLLMKGFEIIDRTVKLFEVVSFAAGSIIKIFEGIDLFLKCPLCTIITKIIEDGVCKSGNIN